MECAHTRRHGGIAQLGEHLLCKQGVKGSNPFISTNVGQKLSWLEHTTDNREVDGSSPFWPTISLLKNKEELCGSENCHIPECTLKTE